LHAFELKYKKLELVCTEINRFLGNLKHTQHASILKFKRSLYKQSTQEK